CGRRLIQNAVASAGWEAVPRGRERGIVVECPPLAADQGRRRHDVVVWRCRCTSKLVGALRASGAMGAAGGHHPDRLPDQTSTRCGPVLAPRPLLAQVRPCIALVVTPEKPPS